MTRKEGLSKSERGRQGGGRDGGREGGGEGGREHAIQLNFVRVTRRHHMRQMTPCGKHKAMLSSNKVVLHATQYHVFCLIFVTQCTHAAQLTKKNNSRRILTHI